jgi:LysR family transcriptional regulator, regulator for bpeEF and oprC
MQRLFAVICFFGAWRMRLLVEPRRKRLDRLRSLQYFCAAAEARSFSGAARTLDLSVAAVSKLVTALERELGLKLFERHAHGLSLTASGANYLEACQPALAMLADAEQQAIASTTRARGTVVVGVQPVVAQQCLTPVLLRFNALYPDIKLDIRYLIDTSEEECRGVDVLLVLGWPDRTGDLVHRKIGATGFVVCAAPAYWAAHGMPQHPRELQRHQCLAIRGNTGILMDSWDFHKGDERVSVAIHGWLLTDNAHRDMVIDVALAGGGVARLLDWHQRHGREIATGALVPALTDWQQPDVPPVNLLYPASVSRIPRVKLVINFITQLFGEIERQRLNPTPSSQPPEWRKAHRARASSASARRL